MSHTTITRINYAKLAVRVCVVLLTGIMFGYIIPGVLSYKTHGYTRKHLLEAMRHNDTMADPVNRNIFLQRDSIATAIGKKIAYLKKSYDSVPVNSILSQIKDYETLRHKVLTEPNTRLTAFADDRISIMWPVLLCSLLIICFIILPFKAPLEWKKFLTLFVIVAAIMFVPNQIRNSEYGDDGRVIFSVFNIDINQWMYYYQMFLYLGTITILTIIWLKSEFLTRQSVNYEFDDYTFEGITEDLDNLKSEYYRWQIFSIALFAVFGSLLYHFYHIVFIEGDWRYLFQAIIFNFLYLLTWIIGSLPLYIRFKKWDKFKQRILYDKNTEKILAENNIDVGELRKFIPPYEIASSVNQTVSILLSAVSFFLPLLKILTQR